MGGDLVAQTPDPILNAADGAPTQSVEAPAGLDESTLLR